MRSNSIQNNHKINQSELALEPRITSSCTFVNSRTTTQQCNSPHTAMQSASESIIRCFDSKKTIVWVEDIPSSWGRNEIRSNSIPFNIFNCFTLSVRTRGRKPSKTNFVPENPAYKTNSGPKKWKYNENESINHNLSRRHLKYSVQKRQPKVQELSPLEERVNRLVRQYLGLQESETHETSNHPLTRN